MISRCFLLTQGSTGLSSLVYFAVRCTIPSHPLHTPRTPHNPPQIPRHRCTLSYSPPWPFVWDFLQEVYQVRRQSDREREDTGKAAYRRGRRRLWHRFGEGWASEMESGVSVRKAAWLMRCWILVTGISTTVIIYLGRGSQKNWTSTLNHSIEVEREQTRNNNTPCSLPPFQLSS